MSCGSYSHHRRFFSGVALRISPLRSLLSFLSALRTEASVRSADKKLSKERSGEIRKATPEKNLRWCEYEPQDTKASRRQPVEQD